MSQGGLFGETAPLPFHYQVTIWVDDDTAALIEKPVVGSGGFQTLMASLQDNLARRSSMGHRELSLTPGQVEKLMRYSRANGGNGGFQGRLARLGETLRSLRGTLGVEA